MELAEAQVIKQGNNLHVQHGTDSGLYVEFYIEAVQDEEKSKEEGRPIFKDVEMISIRILGDKNTHMVRPIDYKGSHTVPSDDVRFAAAYAQFKNKNLPPPVSSDSGHTGECLAWPHDNIHFPIPS